MSKYVDGEGDIPSVYVIRESILGILCPGLAFTLEKDTEKLKWAQKKAGRKKKWGLENVPYLSHQRNSTDLLKVGDFITLYKNFHGRMFLIVSL